jgi:hypothetical protein
MSNDALMHPLEAGRQLHELAQQERETEPTLTYAEAYAVC